MDLNPVFVKKYKKNYHWDNTKNSFKQFIDELYQNSWITTDRVEHHINDIKNYVKNIKDRFYMIYPNCDNLLFTENGNYLVNKNIRNKIQKQLNTDFHINYTYLTNIISVSFHKMIMIDWDKKDGYSYDKCITLLRNFTNKAQKLLIPVVFGLVETDRGYHAFLLSHQLKPNEYTNKLMCLLESDIKYIAYVNLFGWAVRVSQKNTADGDFVGKIGWGDTQIIGDYSIIDNQCWSWFIFHLYCIEYFKKYSPEQFQMFKLYDKEKETHKTNFIQKIRNDLKQLWAYSSTDRPRYIQKIELPTLFDEIENINSLNMNPIVINGNFKINRNSILTDKSGLNIPDIKNLSLFADYVYSNLNILNKNKITFREINENMNYVKRRYYSEVNLHYILYPNLDIYYRTKLNDVISKDIIKMSKDFVIGVDGQRTPENRIFYILLRKILMLDWDFKDGFTENDCINILQQLVDIGNNFGIDLCFKLIRTDRGIHAFEMCNYWDYRNIDTLKIMLGSYCDPWYVCNTNIKGWSIRISQKYKYNDDFIAKYGVLNTLFITNTDRYNLEIDKLINFKMKLIAEFKKFGMKEMEMILGTHQEFISNVRNIIQKCYD